MRAPEPRRRSSIAIAAEPAAIASTAMAITTIGDRTVSGGTATKNARNPRATPAQPIRLPSCRHRRSRARRLRSRNR